MAPPKKNVKMDLGSFLADDSFGGSWADQEVDISSIGVSLDQPAYSTAAPIGGGAGNNNATNNTNNNTSGFESQNFGNDEFKRERKEFPIPDQPPYRARVSNLPWETDENSIVRHFEDRMQAQDIISDVVLPKDRETGRLRGFAFVTFNEREILEESLNLSMSEFQGRKIYVNVAAPPKESESDWRSGRGGNNTTTNTRREPAVELDWGSARNSRVELPPRQRSNRNFNNNNNEEGEQSNTTPRTPRRQEPELDWGSARGARVELPPRQRSNRNFNNNNNEEGEQSNTTPRTPRKQEPELDWGSARSTRAELPIRERSRRTNNTTNTNDNNTTTNTIKKPTEPEFNWKRGQCLPPPRRSNTSTKKEDKKEEQSTQQQGPQKSHFSVLDIEDEEDDEESSENKQINQTSVVGKLTEKTADLSVNDDNDDGWEVVKK